MKKNTYRCKFIFLLISFLLFSINYTYAESDNNSKSFVNIESKYAVVIDFDTGRVLYEKNAYDRSKMASLTKMMTSILLVENCKMDELIEVPKEATLIGGSEVGLKSNDMVSAKALLYGMMLPSGNDAAYTVGLHLGGTIDNFADMMNNKAKKIGVYNTNFANPHGLDDENHYSTAYDMAMITRYALKNKYINEAVKTKSITLNFGSTTKTLTNTNRLLKQYGNIDGVKTGFTNGADRCVIASQTVGDSRYISVILGATNTDYRFNNAKKILDACFDRYTKTDISNLLNFYINIPVEKGNIDSYERKICDNLTLPLASGEYEKIYVKQDIIEKIVPPMKRGDKVGTIKLLIDDEVIYEKDINLEEDIRVKTIKDYLKDAVTSIFDPIETRI